MNTLFGDEMTVPAQSKSNEWYTPSVYIEAARKVMNGIDLDPASCKLANQTVKAAKYFSKEDDGLAHVWKAESVWLNPPYGRTRPEKTGSTRSYQKFFVEKLLREYAQGNIDQAVLLLLGNSCFTKYFQPLWQYPLCFHDGVITFRKANGKWDDFGFGTIFVYLGPNETKFIEAFSKFGRIAKAIDTPKSSDATQSSLWDKEVSA